MSGFPVVETTACLGWRMVRDCPVCGSKEKTLLHSLELTYEGRQSIFACSECGMVYADSKPVNYATSIYDVEGATGSGESPLDKARHQAIVETLFGAVPMGARVLDVGCARGGLLMAMRGFGYTNLFGIDPSPACVTACRDKGLDVIKGTIETAPLRGKFDLITVSHVLEHVPNPQSAMASLVESLAPGGKLYIEVPNARYYSEYRIPFLDFNSEHINHFSYRTLASLLTLAGLEIASHGRKTIKLASQGPDYPAMWAIARRPNLVPSALPRTIAEYVAQSNDQLAKINAYLEQELAVVVEVIIWGCNSYCGNIVNLPVFERVRIVQAIDRNPALRGRKIKGVDVDYDHYRALDGGQPIVITSLMSQDSIVADIQKMGLPNKVVAIRREIYA